MELYELAYAYVRRQRFEAQLLATEVARVLGGSHANTPAGNGRRPLVSADAFLAEAGMVIE